MSEQTTRDSIRAKIFASQNRKGKSKVLPFFGEQVEIRQPTVGQLEDMMKEAERGNLNIVPILIDYAYVPGTNDKVFEDTDTDHLRALPFTPECQAIVNALESFMDLQVEEAAKN